MCLFHSNIKHSKYFGGTGREKKTQVCDVKESIKLALSSVPRNARALLTLRVPVLLEALSGSVAAMMT